MVQLAHSVDQAAFACPFGRRRGSGRLVPRRLRLTFDRPGEELAEAALCLQIPPDHHRVVSLERLGDPIDQRPRKPERVPDLAHRDRAGM